MIPSTQSQREAAYQARFGTAHPRREQVLEWAKELFPDKSLRFKTVQGRTALMDGQVILGVGTDFVEAVACADLTRKKQKLSSTTLGSTNPTLKEKVPMSDPTPDPVAVIKETEIEFSALKAQVTALNQTVSDLNAKLAGVDHSASDELNAVNAELINLNALLGSPLPPVSDVPPLPAPTVPTSTPAPAPDPTAVGSPS